MKIIKRLIRSILKHLFRLITRFKVLKKLLLSIHFALISIVSAHHNHERLGRYLICSHSFSKVLGRTKSISFIFTYYKKEKDILRSIKSLKNQRLKILNEDDIEIIVVDDGSEKLLDHKLDDDIIYVRRNKFKYGISRSRNLGAKISSGKILCFVDPDLIFHKNYVETLFSEYKKYGKYSILTGYINDYHFKGSLDPRTAWGVWEKPNRRTKRFYCLAGGHMAIDRNIFFNSGGFDEDLIYGGVEDVYYGYKLSKNYRNSIVFSTNLYVHHIPHPVGGAHSRTDLSLSILKVKDPLFFEKYIINNER